MIKHDKSLNDDIILILGIVKILYINKLFVYLDGKWWNIFRNML